VASGRRRIIARTLARPGNSCTTRSSRWVRGRVHADDGANLTGCWAPSVCVVFHVRGGSAFARRRRSRSTIEERQASAGCRSRRWRRFACATGNDPRSGPSPDSRAARRVVPHVGREQRLFTARQRGRPREPATADACSRAATDQRAGPKHSTSTSSTRTRARQDIADGVLLCVSITGGCTTTAGGSSERRRITSPCRHRMRRGVHENAFRCRAGILSESEGAVAPAYLHTC
jgi:hypothetical protein